MNIAESLIDLAQQLIAENKWNDAVEKLRASENHLNGHIHNMYGVLEHGDMKLSESCVTMKYMRNINYLRHRFKR